MKKLYPLTIVLVLFTASLVFAREAKLVRYPSYSNGRIAFTYLGDIWTADENGQNVQRLTVNKARDAYPGFRRTENGLLFRVIGTATSTSSSCLRTVVWRSS